MPRGGNAERAMQGSWRQEYGAADAGGPRAQQAGKLETRALFAGSQGGTVAPPSGNTCAPRSAARGSDGVATAGDDRKMNNKPLEREPIDRVRARLEALLKANATPQATAGGWSKMSDE